MSTETELCCDFQDQNGRCDSRVRVPHVAASLPPGWWFGIVPVIEPAQPNPRASIAKHAFEQMMSSIRETLAREDKDNLKRKVLDMLTEARAIAGDFDVPPKLNIVLAECAALAEASANDKSNERISEFLRSIESSLTGAYDQTEAHDLMCVSNTRVQQCHFCPKHPHPTVHVRRDPNEVVPISSAMVC